MNISLTEIESMLDEASKYFPDNRQSATIIVGEEATEICFFFLNGVRTERSYGSFSSRSNRAKAVSRRDDLVGGGTPPVYYSLQYDNKYINVYSKKPLKRLEKFLHC